MIKLTQDHNNEDILVNMDHVMWIRELTRQMGMVNPEYHTFTLIKFVDGSTIQVVEDFDYILRHKPFK